GPETKHESEAYEYGVAVVLAFASKPTVPIFLGPLGWTEIGRMRIWARPSPRLRPRRVEPTARVERFRHAGDAAQEWPNHVVRDSAYLNWRFLQSPRSYTTLAAGGSYAIIGHKEHRGTAVAYVADIIGDPGALLRRSLWVDHAGVRALLAVPATMQRGASASVGVFAL